METPQQPTSDHLELKRKDSSEDAQELDDREVPQPRSQLRA